MSRKPHQYHYIYKTTCCLTKRYYYGMHSTSNLDDGYLGSGSNLGKSIKKYGKENHDKEIIEYLNDRISLKKREAEIINEEMLKDPLCMNLSKGGNGSNYTLGLISVKDKNGNTMSVSINDPRYLNGELVGIFKNKKHSNETKRKIGLSNSLKQKGEFNSQYGTCWITNGIENKKIHKSDNIPEGWSLGRKLKIKL